MMLTEIFLILAEDLNLNFIFYYNLLSEMFWCDKRVDIKIKKMVY